MMRNSQPWGVLGAFERVVYPEQRASAKALWWQQDGSVQGTERGILQGHEACIRTLDFVLNAIGNHRRVLKEA